MLRRNFSLSNSYGEFIRGDIRHAENVKNAPAIIICHGFKGFKDWGFFPSLAENLAETGYVSLAFNFSRNGFGTDTQNFTNLDLFAKNTYTHEIEDLGCVINAIQNEKIGKGLIDPSRIGLLGHSRGAGIVLLYASKNKNIETVVTWAAISTVERFSEDQINAWTQNGYIEMENKRTKQIMRIERDLLQDIEKNKSELNILAAAEKIEIPTMLIHGANDDSVSQSESQEIYKHLSSEVKEIHIIEDANHTFGIAHPMQSRSEEYSVVLDLTEAWFDKYFLR